VEGGRGGRERGRRLTWGFLSCVPPTSQKAEKLQAGLHFLTEEAANKHTVFVDTEVPPSLPHSLPPSSLPFLPLALPPTLLLLSFPALQTTYVLLVTDSFYRHPLIGVFTSPFSFLEGRHDHRFPPQMLAFPSPPPIASYDNYTTIHIHTHIQAEVETFDPAKHFGTDPALVTRAFNRPKLETLEVAVYYKHHLANET
jgi:hypothetical protein